METVEYAPAKLNLGLKILDRRDDGFHNIVSVFQTIDLCDRLTFKPVSDGQISLSCSDPRLSDGADNLVYRAVEAFREHTTVSNGIEIRLEKCIPMEAGLGGGSSDAAAVLRVLNRIWDTQLDTKTLCEIGVTLGSDVPFFIRPKGTAIVTGRGEQLQYVPWSADVFYVLVYPQFKVPTGWAYANFKKALTGSGEYDKFLNSVDFGALNVSDFLSHIENDFLPLVAQTYPETQQILSQLTQAGALSASMSGSGSTLFGVFESLAMAEQAKADLNDRYDRVFLCRPAVS